MTLRDTRVRRPSLPQVSPGWSHFAPSSRLDVVGHFTYWTLDGDFGSSLDLGGAHPVRGQGIWFGGYTKASRPRINSSGSSSSLLRPSKRNMARNCSSAMFGGFEHVMSSGPYGVRTRVSGLRGRRPGPLDEWARKQSSERDCTRQEADCQALLAQPCQPRARVV
jgi:hypothetical protein